MVIVAGEPDSDGKSSNDRGYPGRDRCYIGPLALESYKEVRKQVRFRDGR